MSQEFEELIGSLFQALEREGQLMQGGGQIFADDPVTRRLVRETNADASLHEQQLGGGGVR